MLQVETKQHNCSTKAVLHLTKTRLSFIVNLNLDWALGPELIPVYRQSTRRWPTVSHPSSSTLPLLSARAVVTSPATKHHCPLAHSKLYCLVTEAHRCEQLAQGCYAALPWVGFEPATYWSQVQRSTRCATAPPSGCGWPTVIFRSRVQLLAVSLSGNDLVQVVHTHVSLSPSSIIQYQSRGSDVLRLAR